MHLTAKYFFDAVSAKYAGHLTYRNVERRGEILSQKSMPEDVEQLVNQVTHDLTGRRNVLFACRENACRSQMAAAFAQLYASDRLDVACAGSEPAAAINKTMVTVMQEKGVDMEYRVPKALTAAVEQQPPDEIITMGCGEQCPVVPGAQRHDWDLPDPSGQTIEVMRSVRDEIEQRVQAYLEKL